MARQFPRLAAALGLALLAPSLASARTVEVDSTTALISAIKNAEPGDDIVLADGTYPITGRGKIAVNAQGTPEAPITVRAAHRWKAEIRSSAVVAFDVTGPNWTFKDLDIRGTCSNDTECEHAFHVVGGANNFCMIGNRIADFNAHLKVNAVDRVIPTGGLVEANELFDTHPRQTGNPVVPLDIDHGGEWVIRGNYIYDFHKAAGNEVSYGAFVKGGGDRPIFERNVVVCRRHDETGGTRVGLSFGGGGMEPANCAPNFNANAPCEQTRGGIMRNNIIANCGDVGIYINDAPNTLILFNTLIRTRGIDFRFAGATGEARGNLMASDIRTRDGGTFKDGGNMTRMRSGDLEAMYRDPDLADLRLKGPVTAIAGKGGAEPRVTDDFCGRKRTGAADMGALQSSLGDCPTLP